MADTDTTTIKNIASTLETTSVVTPFDLRLALMDYRDRNIPLYVEHVTDEQLWKCLEWGIANFNDVPPKLHTTYTLSNFPYKKLLLDLATIEALKLTALIELRGEMQYSDGGIQSSIYYKSGQFSSLRQELEAKVSQEITAIKRSLNINACYGALC